MKILITGIEGFTGKYCEEYFTKNGFDVFGTVLSNAKKSNHYICDITNKESLKTILQEVKPEYILHLAAISFVGNNNNALMYNVNVIGTQNILDLCVELNLDIKKIILTSSATVYGNQNREILDESLIPQPVNHYGISKLSMEFIAKTYFEKLPIIMTRPFNYTGKGQENHFLIPKIVSHYKNSDKVIELGNLDVAREFNDINDIVNIYFQLINSTHQSICVNVCSGKTIKLMEIIEYMNEIANYDIEVKVNPAFVRANELKSLSGSTQELEKYINLEFTHTIKDTLLKMYIQKMD